MSLVADDDTRRGVVRTLLTHGFAPDDLYLEDALQLLDMIDPHHDDRPPEGPHGDA